MFSDEYWLRKAYKAALSSPDPRTQNGAVLVKGAYVYEAWNDFAPGVDQREDRWNDRETKYMYVVHAECAALLLAGRLLDGGTDGSILYCCIPACANCAKHLIAGGVRTVVGHGLLRDFYTETNPAWDKEREVGIGMLEEAGVTVRWHEGPVMAEEPILTGGELFDPARTVETQMTTL